MDVFTGVGVAIPSAIEPQLGDERLQAMYKNEEGLLRAHTSSHVRPLENDADVPSFVTYTSLRTRDFAPRLDERRG